MKKSSGSICDDINNFLENFSIDSPLRDSGTLERYKKYYKYYHAALTWQIVLQIDTDDKNISTIDLYIAEMLSDFAHSNLNLLFSQYKSSQLFARSGIENLLRVCALSEGASIEEAKFTHQLITIVRAGNLWSESSPVKNDLEFICGAYGNLCKVVHSHSRPYMSLSIPFSAMSVYSESNFSDVVEMLKGIILRVNRIMFWIFRDRLDNCHYKLKDCILNTLSATLKKAAYE